MADSARVLKIARAVVAHGDVGVNLARVRLALLYLAVVVLDEDVVHQLDRARFDLCLTEGEVDVAATVSAWRLPLGLLRLADRVVHLDVKALLAAGVAGERYRPRAVIDRARPGASDIARAVVLRALGGAVVRPAELDAVGREACLRLDEHRRRWRAVGAVMHRRLRAPGKHDLARHIRLLAAGDADRAAAVVERAAAVSGAAAAQGA